MKKANFKFSYTILEQTENNADCVNPWYFFVHDSMLKNTANNGQNPVSFRMGIFFLCQPKKHIWWFRFYLVIEIGNVEGFVHSLSPKGYWVFLTTIFS